MNKTTRKQKVSVKIANYDVPACLVHGSDAIAKGTRVNAVKETFCNGEHWYTLDNGSKVPSIFFVDAE